MLSTAIGLILFLFPLLLVYRFQDKILGFVYILSGIIAGHLIIALVTQALNIFTYPCIIFVHTIIMLLVIGDIIKDKNFRLIFLKKLKVDWIFILSLIIIFIHLYQVHYNYSGKYSTVVLNPTFQEARGMVYPYPYFVDEWHAIIFTKYAIRYNTLALTNPLLPFHSLIPNFAFVFHGFLAELFVLFSLDPLKYYVPLTMICSMLICILIYWLLRYEKAGKLTAAMASLSTLYITNGANLPGLWTLIPATMTVICLLLAFFFVIAKDFRVVVVALLMGLAFYPAALFFYLIIFIAAVIGDRKLILRDKINLSAILLLGIFIVGGVHAGAYWGMGKSFSSLLKNRVYAENLITDSIPQYVMGDIVPVPIIIFAAVGFLKIWRRRPWLAGLLVLGLSYWLFYAFSTKRILIDYQRVVILTSIILVIISGYGLDVVVTAVSKRWPPFLVKIASALVLLFSFSISFHYTQREQWRKLVVINQKTKEVYHSAAPANRYLQEDDLEIFRNIKRRIFLAPPWKGTVVAAATDNFPLTSKVGVIGDTIDVYRKFMSADCEQKYTSARNTYLDYVYVPFFKCPHFEPLIQSREGLVLYRFLP